MIAIEVVDGSSEQLLEFLAEQDLDTVLTIFEGKDSKFTSRVLFKEPYMLAVPKDHRFAQRQSVQLADLEGEPLIVRTRCDFDRALALVAAGIGVALVPAHYEESAVTQIPVSHLGISRAIGLLWSREREYGDLKGFIEFAGSHCWAA